MRGLPSFDEIIGRFPALRAVGEASRRRSIPFIQQLSQTECGAACLAMVLRYYGKTVSVDELRASAVSGRDATNAQVLLDTAARYGLRGRAVTLDLEQLPYLDRGTVLHWNFTHFVVFDRMGRGAVHIVDPARGRRQIPMTEFGKHFTGVALLFEPDDGFERSQRHDRTVLRYLRQILTERRFLPHIVVSSLLLQLLGLTPPLLTRLVIDQVIPRQDYSLLIVLAVGALLLAGVQALASLARGYLLLFLRTRLESRMTLGFLDHLLGLPFDFFQRRSTGDLMVRLGTNATVREILTGTMLSATLDGTLAVTYLLVLLTVSGPLAMLTMALASVQIALFVFTRHKQRQFLAQALEAQSNSQGYLVEVLSAIETLKSMGLERRAVDRWSALFTRQLNVSLDQGRLNTAVEAVSVVVRLGSAMALLGTGTVQVLAGRISLGDMLALIAIANGFLGPLLGLVSNATQLQQLVIYLERLDDVLQTPGERDRENLRPAARLTGSMTIDDVSFRYGPASPTVVRGVTLDVGGGEFVAIVGRSGSGKSTLARLLVGLYAPTDGRVSYDGVDLQQYELTTLRRQIGVVTQQAQLFAGTIRSNIALAEPELPLEAIIEAAKMAQIHDDIDAMPMGYNTPLLDRGTSLSGGQQQRIALARALAAKPRVLVLDEATSQLDATTEQMVQSSLARLACTRIVIAHRLSTIMNADRILVMEDGKLIEQGRHDDLVMRRGAYARLVAAQMPPDLTPR